MKKAFILTTMCLIGFTANAQQNERSERPRKPPQEAIDACVDKAENDAVTFVGRRGEELQSTCLIIEGVLVAVPNNHKRKPRQHNDD
jgi:hypothetical protein